MNLVDSCGWLEYFAEGANAGFFVDPIEDTDRLLVPTICLLEVFKRVFQQRGEAAALRAVTNMQEGRLAPLDAAVAMTAARISAETGLPTADSIILATARAHGATIWTQDRDFEGISGVQYRAKP